MKIKFNEDRGVFKKGTVIELKEDLAAQLLSTGNEGSVSSVDDSEKATDRADIYRHIKSLNKKKAEKAKQKLEALKD